MSEKTREELAAYAHDAWAGWMRYMFSKCASENECRQVTIPGAMVQRWKRQMETPYHQLSESEKKSDLAEADKILEIVRGGS